MLILSSQLVAVVRVPTWKNGRHFLVREKSVNSVQNGKIRENKRKYWKTQEISDKCYLLFLVIFE